ncbi:MAG: murein L,D-transpeptidase [Acidimicrobiia bacterium]|nr:murein L,D-transpeptidase [Acidimicrobiia bacterium]
MGGTAQRIRWAGAWLLAVGLIAAACGSGSPAAQVPSIPTTTIPTPATVRSTTTTTMSAPPTTTATMADPTMPDPTVPRRVTTTTTLDVPEPLEPGDRGPGVVRLQEAMAAAGFFRDEIDGSFGPRTAAAVIAVHKALDLERTAAWATGDWAALSEYEGPVLPDRTDEPNRVEVDLTRQLLYRLEDGAVVDIIPVSSGNGALYENATGALVRARTPRGDYSFYKHYTGWRISYLGGLYRPWYFSGGYAIHGSASVPAYPASHGCVRVPNWEADHLASELWIGSPVHLWD